MTATSRPAPRARAGTRAPSSWLGVASIALFACAGPARNDDAPAPSARAETEALDRVVVPGGALTVDGLAHRVEAFALDRTFATRAGFERFVLETGHLTHAERDGDGAVFDLRARRWTITRGATFRMPRGPGAEQSAADHPATQIDLADAEAYCAWRGGRVPTEREWEHAARNARDDRAAYPWGAERYPAGRARANTWDGAFPAANTLRDGHLFASPVTAFAESALGLRDIVGNVWHWTRSPFDASAAEGDVALRGGSHLCDAELCHGFRIDARQRAARTDRFAHVGVRCRYDLSRAEAFTRGSASSGAAPRAE